MTAHVVAPPVPGRTNVLAEARYYREHVLPWLTRRLRGRSSGDERTGKHAERLPVEAMA